MKHLLYTKLRGVSYTQPIIKDLSAGEELYLVRDCNNKYDANCISANSATGKVGYISRELAETLAPLMDSGTTLRCFVTAITGGNNDHYLGLNIEIFIV